MIRKNPLFFIIFLNLLILITYYIYIFNNFFFLKIYIANLLFIKYIYD